MFHRFSQCKRNERKWVFTRNKTRLIYMYLGEKRHAAKITTKRIPEISRIRELFERNYDKIIIIWDGLDDRISSSISSGSRVGSPRVPPQIPSQYLEWPGY